MSVFPEFPGTDGCFGMAERVSVLNVQLVGSGHRERARQVLNKDNYEYVENVYKVAQRYNIPGDSLKKRIVRYDDSNAEGEYYTLDGSWQEIENHRIDKNRIGVGRGYGGNEARVYIQIGRLGTTKQCEDYMMFDRKEWIELRKSRGVGKYKPMKIDENGTIWTGVPYNGCNIRVFIRGE